MASALQQAVTIIRLSDYTTREFVDLQASYHCSPFFQVTSLTAVGYDYSE